MKLWGDLTEDERDRTGAYFAAVGTSRDFGPATYGATSARAWYVAALDEMQPKGDQNAVSRSDFGNFLAEELHDLSDAWMEQPSSAPSRHQAVVELEEHKSELRRLIEAQPF